MMPRSLAGRVARLSCASGLLVLLLACAPQSLLVRAAADQLAGQAAQPEDDVVLAREASAFYLKLSESVLARAPGHLRLAEAVAGGFTQYAYAFVVLEAERLESRDARAAQRLRERAARLYWRAHRHAMTALEHHNPGLSRQLAAADASSPATRIQLPAEQAAVGYWAAASWGAYIALSKDKPDVVADLPQVVQLARLVLASDPDYGEGAALSLMGTLEAARPGGSRPQAEIYFERAITASAGRSAGPMIAKADALALPDGDRAGFEALLRQAIAISTRHPSLENTLLRERAQWLLETLDDRF